MAAATSTSAALSFANLASSRSSSITGSSPLSSSPRPSLPLSKPSSLSCRAQKSDSDSAAPPALSRRTAFSLLAAAAAISTRINPAEAAYGEAANIFGTAKVDPGFVQFTGKGFKIKIPSKWNPSKEVEFPGTVLRYEDNFDSNSNLAVMVLPASKSSIKDYGSPQKFLESVNYLLGKQAYAGKTQSEGGFQRDAVVKANIIESSTPVIDGKEYYSLSVLTQTADGGEGGRHQLIVGAVADGKLYICKAQAGDKRWFKGAKKYVEEVANSFSLA